MVEVYKTNVMEVRDADFLLQRIHENFNHYSANFDLEDCDKILRVESDIEIESALMIKLFNYFNFRLEILPDVIHQ